MSAALVSHLVSLALIALGVAGFGAGAFIQLRGSGYYTVGSEFILYALLIAAGVGLFMRKRAGRVLALAWLRVGSLAIFVIPIGIAFWMMTLRQTDGNIFQILGGLYLAVLLLAAEPSKGISPLWAVIAALLFLTGFSYGCALLYRRLAVDPSIIDTPARPCQEAPLLGERGLVPLLAVVFLALAFGAQHRVIIPEYQLPGALQSKHFQQQMTKLAEEQLANLVGAPFLVEGGKGLVYILNNERGLVYVDTATGTATRLDLPKEVLGNPVQSVQRPSARFSADGSLFWSNHTNELVDLHTGRRLKAQLEPGYDRYLAVAFVKASHRFLLFDKVNTRIVCLDTATAAPVYSVDVQPPGGFSSEQYRMEFIDRLVSRGRLSGNRLAWFYLDTLFILDAESGAVASQPVRAARDTNLHFSREGDRVLIMKPYDTRPGALVDLRNKTVREHGIHGLDALYFSASEGLIAYMPRPDGGPFEMTVMRWSLADLGTPLWKAGFNGRWHIQVSGDGKRLLAYNPAAHQLESADLAGLSGQAAPVFEPLPVTLPPGSVKWISYFPEGALLVAVQSPKMAIVRFAPSGEVAQSTAVDFTRFAARPED